MEPELRAPDPKKSHPIPVLNMSTPRETGFSGFIRVGRNIVPGPASLRSKWRGRRSRNRSSRSRILDIGELGGSVTIGYGVGQFLSADPNRVRRFVLLDTFKYHLPSCLEKSELYDEALKKKNLAPKGGW